MFNHVIPTIDLVKADTEQDAINQFNSNHEELVKSNFERSEIHCQEINL